MSDTAQNHVWDAMYHCRHAKASIDKAYEACQDNSNVWELINFAATSAEDAHYFLRAITRRLRELEKE